MIIHEVTLSLTYPDRTIEKKIRVKNSRNIEDAKYRALGYVYRKFPDANASVVSCFEEKDNDLEYLKHLFKFM